MLESSPLCDIIISPFTSADHEACLTAWIYPSLLPQKDVAITLRSVWNSWVPDLSQISYISLGCTP